MGELQRILWQNKTLINVNGENLLDALNFLLGKPKVLPNMPNGSSIGHATL